VFKSITKSCYNQRKRRGMKRVPLYALCGLPISEPDIVINTYYKYLYLWNKFINTFTNPIANRFAIITSEV